MDNTERLVQAIEKLTKEVARLSHILPYCDYCNGIKICDVKQNQHSV